MNPSLELKLLTIMKNTQNGTGPPLAKQKEPGGWLQDSGLIDGGFISHAY